MPALMEATKSHSLPSASWRTKKFSDVIQSESEDMRNRGVLPSLKSKTQEPGAPMSECRKKMVVQAQKKEKDFTLPLPFCSIWALSGLDDACPHW